MNVNLMVSPPNAETGIPECAIRDQLSRVLDSSVFVHSQRLSRFLRFTVEAALAGQADERLRQQRSGVSDSGLAALPRSGMTTLLEMTGARRAYARYAVFPVPR